MTNPFDTLGDKSMSDISKAEEIDGLFGCESCSKQINKAYYYSDTRLLEWKCPDGHVSRWTDISI